MSHHFYPAGRDISLLSRDKHNSALIKGILESLRAVSKGRTIAFPERVRSKTLEALLAEKEGIFLTDQDFERQSKEAAEARHKKWLERQASKLGPPTTETIEKPVPPDTSVEDTCPAHIGKTQRKGKSRLFGTRRTNAEDHVGKCVNSKGRSGGKLSTREILDTIEE